MERDLEAAVRDEHRQIDEALGSEVGRRQFLRFGAVGVGGLALLGAACSDQSAGPAGESAGSSVFDRALDGDTIRVGADLNFPPLQLRDANGQPAGYTVELAQAMFEDLNPDAKLEFVEVPFGELFGALAAGRFDMSAIGATILPSRSRSVMFASEPLFIENTVVLRNTGSPVRNVDQMNSSSVRIAVLAGSAQEASARRLFPNASLVSLEQQPAIQEAATGRADVVLVGEFGISRALSENSSLVAVSTPPIFADINTWFMAIGDHRMRAYVDNWLRYNIIRGRLASFWNERVGNAAREAGARSIGLISPYLASSAVLGDTIG
jgi:ABC-type amino acid transport substrate-binding protein